jgi:mercuric ion transport protein
VKAHLEKLGGVGAVIAAAACPVCFPKLALIGALFGLGALGAYESQIFIGVQILTLVAVAGHILNFLGHRRKAPLIVAMLSGAAVFAGLYVLASEWLTYAGFAGLVALSALDLWKYFRRRNYPARGGA